LETLNQAVSQKMQEYTSSTTAVMSAQSSCEEMYLFQKILREIGVSNIDHRSKECDFGYQDYYPIIPSFDIKLSEIESMENIILVNVNISKEFPILSVYLRNAVKQMSTNIISLSAYEYIENFDISHSETLSPKELENYFSTTSNNILSNVSKDKKNLIIMGPSITYLKNYTNIANNISSYAKSINSKLSLLGDQCNTSGAWAMGVVPHRLPGGIQIEEFKQTAYHSSYPENNLLIIYNLEPEYDFSNDTEIIDRLKKSKFNIFFSSYMTDSINKYADVVYPLAVQQESHGSYLNTNKQLQVFNQVISPRGQSKNGLEILLGLSKRLGINIDDEQISKDINEILSKMNIKSNYILIDTIEMTNEKNTLEKIIIRSSNSNNPTLRRCKSLLTTHDNDDFMSIPNSMKINSESKITINESENSFKIKANIKVHDKPDNTILVKMNGRYAQKIGSYNTSVDLS
jgi:NADH-quinone oxidoreductase subunit G